MKFVRLEGRAGDLEMRSLNLMKTIGHARLVRIFGAWQKDGYLILAMDLAEATLAQRLEEAVGAGLVGIPPGLLVTYMSHAAEGLDYLNVEKGVQHRDVKPKNLLLKSGCVLVADFGLAKVLEQTLASHTGSMTVAYAAPEFFEDRTTRWSDQYSLAVTYCQLRGNKLPFRGNAAQITAGHLTKPPDLSMVPAPEREPVARALDKDPTKRWPTCRAFIDALAPLVAASVDMLPETLLAGWANAPTIVPQGAITNSLGMKFAWIPPGTFRMGGDQYDDEKPVHRVTLTRGFYMGVHPVTQAQWEAVMGSNPSHFQGADRPVETVSWDDCQDFCARLAKLMGKPVRLPTEAEWEYACRAGTTTDYYSGDGAAALKKMGWYSGNSDGRTQSIGKLAPNAWGLYDMHGNVWEWCQDWYGPYPQGDAVDYLGSK